MQQYQTLVLNTEDKQPDTQQGSIFFIGTATVLLRYAGFTILTDPNFLHRGEHVHLGYGLQSERLTNPAMEMEQLPPLDFVLLSHLHEDHFDRYVEQKLSKEIPIITTEHAAKALKEKGFTATRALATWDGLTIIKGDARVRVTAMPAQHAPGVISYLLPPVMGSMLEFFKSTNDPLIRIYITGDTIPFDDLNQIPQRYPHIQLALIHLGGTKIMGMTVTMNGRQGAEFLKLIDPDAAIPLHYNDYTVFKSPLGDFVHAVTVENLEKKIHYLRHGETYTFQTDSPE